MDEWWNKWAGVALLAPFLLFGAVMKIREWRQRRRSAARLAAALDAASRAGQGVHRGPGWVVHNDAHGSRVEYDPHR
jgi:hypothetical protein